MTQEECPLYVTLEEYEAFAGCEAVIVREYELADGSRTANVVSWGNTEDMQLQASVPCMVVVSDGMKIVCQRVVPVSVLLGCAEHVTDGKD